MAAELRVVTRTSMLAGPLRPAASNHPFSHITARTLRIWPYSAVERSEERLNCMVVLAAVLIVGASESEHLSS